MNEITKNTDKIINEFWQSFLNDTNLDKKTKYIESFHFEMTEKLANELLNLVLIGKKKATASSKLFYDIENQPMPKEGDYSIVTDWDGNPRCVIKTTSVKVMPFKEETYDICKKEGEDENLESWQQGHIKFFTNEAKEYGYNFSEDMPVVFEEFEVVYKK